MKIQKKNILVSVPEITHRQIATYEFKRIIEVAYHHVKGNLDISTTALKYIKKYYYKT
jgi:hypothetical protein